MSSRRALEHQETILVRHVSFRDGAHHCLQRPASTIASQRLTGAFAPNSPHRSHICHIASPSPVPCGSRPSWEAKSSKSPTSACAHGQTSGTVPRAATWLHCHKITRTTGHERKHPLPFPTGVLQTSSPPHKPPRQRYAQCPSVSRQRPPCSLWGRKMDRAALHDKREDPQRRRYDCRELVETASPAAGRSPGGSDLVNRIE